MLTPADPAPCVVLRLRDTPETRELWPHAFEVLYKITLMEDDSPEEEGTGPDPGQDPQVCGGVAVCVCMWGGGGRDVGCLPPGARCQDPQLG
jgi:hypothetical protein